MRTLLPLLCMTSLACAQDHLVWNKLEPLPDPLGFAGPIAGITNGGLLVGGGANFPDKLPWEGGTKVWHDRVWLLSEPNGAWQLVGKLPRPLGYSVCVTYQNSVISVGGSDPEKHFSNTWRLAWRDGSLVAEELPSLPIALSGASGALLGDTLFVACGSEKPGEQSATNRAFALNLSKVESGWRELPPLPASARILAAGSSDGSAFYVIGGCALLPGNDGKVGRIYLRDAWKYREGVGWTRIVDLPKPSVAAPSPAPYVSGRILLLSGDDGSLSGFKPLDRHPGFPAEVLAYDPAADRWSPAGKVPAPRATLPVVEWNGRFVLPSGEQRPGVRSPEVWSFTPSTK